MADIHLSSSGSSTSPYDTWAKAATSWSVAAAAMSAGDRLVVDSTFATAAGTAINITFATNSQILSGVPASPSGLASLAAGAQCASSSATGITLNGIGVYVFGVTLVPGTANLLNIILGSVQSKMVFDTCVLPIPSGAGSGTRFGSTTAAVVSILEFRNCTLEPGGNYLYLLNGVVKFFGGTFGVTASTCATPFYMSSGNRSTDLEFVGFDFSNLPTNAALLTSNTAAGMYEVLARDCKFSSGFAGSLNVNGYGQNAEWWNCAVDNTTYRLLLSDGLRTISDETSIVRSGGATDGTTPLAWKVATTSDCGAAGAAKTPPMVTINTSVGSAVTISIEMTHSNAAFTNATAWLEVEYLGSTASGSSTALSTKAAPLAVPTAHPASAASWGGSQTQKQKLSATFTPQKPGPFNLRVCVATASTTLYIDPFITIT